MIKLNFPGYNFRLLEKGGGLKIFDPVRKKYVSLTPEEWVRQHVIAYFTGELHVPVNLIRVEAEIVLNRMRKRCDVAVFDRNGQPLLLAECKAPEVRITSDVLDQAVRYNMVLKVGFVMLTNGLQHVFFKMDRQTGQCVIVNSLPDYPELIRIRE